MNGPLGDKANKRTMGEPVAESDIDRLMSAARNPAAAAKTTRVSRDEFAARLNLHRNGGGELVSDVARASSVTIWDIPIFILYALLGVFTRIWTDVTLYFDFGDDTGFRSFAIGVSMALHGFIIAIVMNAWRAKWEIRVRNLLAMAALGGYLGFRMLTQM